MAKILEPKDLMPNLMLLTASASNNNNYHLLDTFIMSHISFMHIISFSIPNNHKKSTYMYMCAYECMQIEK